MEIYAIKNMLFYVGFFTTFTFTVYFLSKARSAERQLMIEKGLTLPKPIDLNQLLFKFAFILIGTSVGILVGYALVRALLLPEPIGYTSMILLFSGLGIIVHQLIFSSSKHEFPG